jgi:hypothetical protein
MSKIYYKEEEKLKFIQSPPKIFKVLLQCILEFLYIGSWGLLYIPLPFPPPF